MRMGWREEGVGSSEIVRRRGGLVRNTPRLEEIDCAPNLVDFTSLEPTGCPTLPAPFAGGWGFFSATCPRRSSKMSQASPSPTPVRCPRFASGFWTVVEKFSSEVQIDMGSGSFRLRSARRLTALRMTAIRRAGIMGNRPNRRTRGVGPTPEGWKLQSEG